MPYGSYCTQIDASGSGRERCGGACLASCLLDEGYQSDPWALTVQVSDGCGITDRGATSLDLIACAANYGLDGRLWYTTQDAGAALAAGEAVLVLCDNQYLEPRPYPAGYGWEAMHWIRIVAYTAHDTVAYVYDPLTYMGQKDGSIYQGPTAMDVQTIMRAVQVTPYSEAGVILSSRQGKNLNAR
jgi:hypothetical protein